MVIIIGQNGKGVGGLFEKVSSQMVLLLFTSHMWHTAATSSLLPCLI